MIQRLSLQHRPRLVLRPRHHRALRHRRHRYLKSVKALIEVWTMVARLKSRIGIYAIDTWVTILKQGR